MSVKQMVAWNLFNANKESVSVKIRRILPSQNGYGESLVCNGIKEGDIVRCHYKQRVLLARVVRMRFAETVEGNEVRVVFSVMLITYLKKWLLHDEPRQVLIDHANRPTIFEPCMVQKPWFYNFIRKIRDALIYT